MDPMVNPQGTLGMMGSDNPLIRQAGGMTTVPTATDTAQQPTQPPTITGSPIPPAGGLATPVSGGATLGQRLPNVFSTFLSKFAAGSKNAMAAGMSPLAAQVVGAVHANDPNTPEPQPKESTLQKNVGAIRGALGDVAAVGTVPAGGGALTGVARTMGAQNQRLQQEKEKQQQQQHQQFEDTEKKRMDDATIAHVQQQTLAAQQALRITGNDEKRKALDLDKAVVADATQGQVPVLAEGLNDEQLHKWMQANPDKIQNVLPVVESLKPEFDAQGNEFDRPVYRLYDRTGTVKVGKEAAATFDKYMPQEKSWEGQEMPFVNYMAVKQSAALTEAQDMSRRKAIAEVAKNEGEAQKYEQDVKDKKQHEQYGRDIAPTMNHYGQDPIDALDNLKKINTPEATEMARKISEYYTPKLIEEMRSHQENEAIKRQTEQDKLLEKQKKQSMATNRAADLVDALDDPTLLSKRSEDYNAVFDAAQKYSMEHYGKRWDPAQAVEDYKYATSERTQNRLKYINSLTGNPKTGTDGNLDGLINISNSINRTQFPALNDAAGWLRAEAGDPAMAKFHNYVVDAADQFANIMSGGSGNATTDAKIQQGLEMFQKGFNKETMLESAKSVKEMLQRRKTEIIADNRYLQHQYGLGANRGDVKQVNVNGQTGTYMFDGKQWVLQKPQGQ